MHKIGFTLLLIANGGINYEVTFISDIHGSAYYAKKALEIFNKEKADFIVILGDELYHGARNPLPLEYNPQEVIALLNYLGIK